MIRALLFSALLLANTKAPDFELQKLNGETVRLSKQRGSVILVDFWASWCGSCKLTLPYYAELQKKYAAKNFKVLAVNVDKDISEAIELATEVESSGLSVIFDAEGLTPYRYGVKIMPTSFLIDRDGNITAIFEGSKNKNLEEIIEKSL